MSFLPFFRGFLITLVAFGVSTYLMTGSLWSTLVQTAICGVLIQIGYFAAIVFLVQRSAGERSDPKKACRAEQGGEGASASEPIGQRDDRRFGRVFAVLGRFCFGFTHGRLS
jgi:exopolysaccharide production repressor protein